MLPYQSVPINNRVFMNGERARTWASAAPASGAPTPGMFASVNGPVPPADGFNFPCVQLSSCSSLSRAHSKIVLSMNCRYYSACGIQQLAYQQVLYTDVVTPYATMPVSLGLALCEGPDSNVLPILVVLG
jgi:hypothetical protein